MDDVVTVRRGRVVDDRVVVGEALDPARDDKPGRVVCRCGRSEDRPWCDGSHRRPASDAVTGAPPGPTPPTVAWAGAPGATHAVGVVVVADGPLVVVGLPVEAGDHTVPASRTGMALCRCGRVAEGWCDGGCPGGAVVVGAGG